MCVHFTIIHTNSFHKVIYCVDVSGCAGRRFDGVGAISGGGATSKLLTNYPEPQRGEILDFLFKPNFGAALHILKVELGGDAQSTEGCESSHIHYGWDENYERGYEWWLMKQAKLRNPAIKLYGLPWGFPGWLASDTFWPYANTSILADYVVRWVKGAKQVHNLTIDYVGIWNEKPYLKDYVIELRSLLDYEGFSNVKLVVGDLGVPGAWEVAADMLGDKAFTRAVDIIGIHYPGTDSDSATRASGKALWSSEDLVLSGKNVAKEINRNYVHGLLSGWIGWNLVSSYYDALPVPGHGLMLANQPWAGHYQVNDPVWAVAHTSQFSSPGWTYLCHGRGVDHLKYGGSIVSMRSPSSANITVVVETIDASSIQNATLYFNSSQPIKKLHIWRSRIGREDFVYLGAYRLINNKLTLQLGIDEIWTVTTLQRGTKGNTSNIPPAANFPLPYKDSFEGEHIGTEAYNFAQQVGVFEVVEDAADPWNHVLQQMSLQAAVHWCPLTMNQPITYIGNYNWTNVRVDVLVRFPAVNASSGAIVGARVRSGGCFTALSQGIYASLLHHKQEAHISLDLARTRTLSSVSVPLVINHWYILTLTVQDTRASVMLDGRTLMTTVIPTEESMNGFVALGADTLGLVQFDDFKISSSD